MLTISKGYYICVDICQKDTRYRGNWGNKGLTKYVKSSIDTYLEV